MPSIRTLLDLGLNKNTKGTYPAMIAVVPQLPDDCHDPLCKFHNRIKPNKILTIASSSMPELN